MIRLLGFVALATLPFASAQAAELSNMAPIGAHYRVITVEKSINPENIMVVYTKVDSQCRFLTDPAQRDQPVFDYYWLMDRKNYKPVHKLIKGEVRKRLEFQIDPSDRHNSFFVNMNDLKEVRHDLRDGRLNVRSEMIDGKCQVNATMTLGASAGNAKIYLNKVYSEAKKGLIMPSLVSITLSGKDVNSGKAISKTYKAK